MLIKLARHTATSIPPITLQDLGKNEKLNFVVSSDFYRVDVGVILCRRPIFFDMEDYEYEKIKWQYKINMKYNLYPAVTKELMDFDRTDIEKPSSTSDDNPTHIRRNANAKHTYFWPNSKYFKYVNPDVEDYHSIQNAPLYNVYFLCKKNGKWSFPETPARMDQSLSITKERLYERFSKKEYKILFTSKYPLCVKKEDLPEEEVEKNEFYNKCIGKKIFYYQAFHDFGPTKKVHEYEDYAWVPKPKMNKFLNQPDFDFFMKLLKETNN